MADFFNRQLQHLSTLGIVSQNARLLFMSTTLNGISQGIFIVVFNLYILNLGIPPDVLGAILSAGPFAQALGSIPIGFLMEKIGFKKVFLIIYGGAALARLFQVSTPYVSLISIAAFTGGLAMAGDFVVRLPFLAANTDKQYHNQIYSMSSILMAISQAVGALLGGFAPNLIQHLFATDLTITYRYTLFLAGVLSLMSILPVLKIKELPRAHTRKISLAPYLWGMDRFTIMQAVVSLFVGVSLGLVNPFMNIYYLYHLGTTREFFGTVSALLIIPALIATSLGPVIARAIGSVRSVTLLRSAIPAFMVNFALTTNPWLGTISYWFMNSFSTTSQPLSFAFAMRAAKPRAKSAASAWLNVTFWLGQAVAAPLSGAFILQENYRGPLFIAAGCVLIAGILNQFFFSRIEFSLNQEDLSSAGVPAEAG